ncbi:MAG TPA: AAA family ATPase [Alphaproteobacteria bacterium]|nr:AAA family ATPase [Alphaproteobacteria bacterium]HQS94802.1 AAA family ATPase [Alphaproteobacteria bacterium]
MIQFKRLLSIDLAGNQSAFLWGARKTGKSTLLKVRFPDAIQYDFLKSDAYFKYSSEPHRFREELEQGPRHGVIIVDEVQKIPEILDEIDYIIESSQYQFVLCGSSARKVRRSGVNMLGDALGSLIYFPSSAQKFQILICYACSPMALFQRIIYRQTRSAF